MTSRPHSDRPPETMTAERVLLRRETTDDAAAVANLIERNLHRLSEFMPWALPGAADVTAQHDRIVASAIAWDCGTEYDYVIVVDSEIVGKCGLPRHIEPDGFELGYWLDADAEGHGYVTEAARALTDAALDLDGISRVEIHCDAGNVRSAAVPRRLGYELDRTERVDVVTRGQTGDQMIWVTSRPSVTTP
ncbi:GNAT family N-acetyltransferase [Actinomycetes bacterium M1A6_2h]